MASLAQRQIYRAAMQLFAERGLTQISVTDLAQAAGVARGTIYNNLDDLTGLFDLVATHLAAELNGKIIRALQGCDDPILRLANGMRLLIRHAHVEPQLGRFICRFGLSSATLRVIWTGQPLADLRAGLAAGRYGFGESQLPSAVNFISGATLGAMVITLDGAQTWSEAAAETVEWVLIALGVGKAEARALSTGDLPPLPE
ncbi:AcrR family transcriptional regulator [Rhodopseudomonas rhenobacensis]|uniref:AcrR family transcriptional regulator n=1 Tax=Rhodopseudomonas rhenobacensis TaxID=87461 RepID=A0A7W7Z787_9BRAD|nr:TetR family transcriptional regulator [Rhodopseudomonas rhenobacensis]MBB5049153.1 AcrR family transcriptional regulator [Rhodopseudomonas rhenobacensis]